MPHYRIDHFPRKILYNKRFDHLPVQLAAVAMIQILLLDSSLRLWYCLAVHLALLYCVVDVRFIAIFVFIYIFLFGQSINFIIIDFYFIFLIFLVLCFVDVDVGCCCWYRLHVCFMEFFFINNIIIIIFAFSSNFCFRCLSFVKFVVCSCGVCAAFSF